MQKNIFIHIGCGKTGSSALQVWISQNAEALSAAGINYVLNNERLEDYAISSGNGTPLIKAIKKRRLPKFLKPLLEDDAILFSSEMFQLLTEEEVCYLRDELDTLGVTAHIIAYIRDVYDIMYSSYLQRVKRRQATETFAEFALEQTTHLQFDAIRRWSATFETIDVIHYDTHKQALEQAFLNALELSEAGVPPMHKKKVNRSLTLMELELLRAVNTNYLASGKHVNGQISSLISNALIDKRPELKTPIYMDKSVLDHLERSFRSDVTWVNQTFFEGRENLRIFTPEGKHIENDLPDIDPTFFDILETLMNLVERYTFEHSEKPSLSQRLKRVFR